MFRYAVPIKEFYYSSRPSLIPLKSGFIFLKGSIGAGGSM
jgi:hypothetical protein